MSDLHRNRSLGELVARFRAALPAASAECLLTDASLGALLESVVTRAQEEWPDVTVDIGNYVAFVAACLPAGAKDLEAALHRVIPSDLWLVAAVLEGDDAALGEVHRLVRKAVRSAARSCRLAGDVADEVEQALQIRLLVGTSNAPPALSSFKGKGSLRSWLRVAAARQVARQVARQGTEPRAAAVNVDEVVNRLQLDAPGLDVALMKAAYQAEFRDAVREAVAALSPRDRNLVRYVAVDGLSFQQIAGLYHVSRTTLWRWYGSIRECLLRCTRERLAQKLDLAPPEIDSILRFISSRLEATLSDVA